LIIFARVDAKHWEAQTTLLEDRVKKTGTHLEAKNLTHCLLFRGLFFVHFFPLLVYLFSCFERTLVIVLQYALDNGIVEKL
jgi:hypothetical protein